jgi:hypothetical protein
MGVTAVADGPRTALKPGLVVIRRPPVHLASLYEADETAWLESMAELIEQGQYGKLDYPHLGEYLADMAKRDRREVESRLASLIAHRLKWDHQPKRRSRSWRGTILVQSQELRRLLGRGVLRNHAEAMLAEVYVDAVKQAIAETGLSPKIFPADCPYTLEQLLSDDILDE